MENNNVDNNMVMEEGSSITFKDILRIALKYKFLIVPGTIPYILPEAEVQDIDTMSDWEIAEAKYKVLHKGEI